jgi:hypothetical protein
LAQLLISGAFAPSSRQIPKDNPGLPAFEARRRGANPLELASFDGFFEGHNSLNQIHPNRPVPDPQVAELSPEFALEPAGRNRRSPEERFVEEKALALIPGQPMNVTSVRKVHSKQDGP